MFIAFIKFIHLVCVLGSVGLVGVGLWLSYFNNNLGNTFIGTESPPLRFATLRITGRPSAILNGINLLTVVLATVTGCLLVQPKGYTFHTPWIRAALLLVSTIIVGLLNVKALRYIAHQKIYSLVHTLLYSFLLILLMVIIHDAVQKTTAIPLPWLGLGL